ncbi:MAG: MFS transporter [Actinomycetota bacterium]|nr:MFS transporter [Actinomycetota bacterium]
MAAADVGTRRGGVSSLYQRQLEHYPDTGPRSGYLAITVLATVMLYYELYVNSSVSTLILAKLHMSFSFLVVTLAFANLIGAFGSLLAGLTDRLGRTNLVVAGLGVTAVFVAFLFPLCNSKWPFTACLFAVGLVEGICLVATPALIRDFSPQAGRATAMGFWTSGPVLGSLIVAVVASNTIGAHPSPAFWTHEFKICGIAGLIVFVLALIFMRELSPGLRDQLMVTMNDRALIEARAKGIDIEASLRSPFRQLAKPKIFVSAMGVSVMLLFYYTTVAFSIIYLGTIFGFSTKDANGLGNWAWGFNVLAVIGVGIFSDKIRVRKPFMLAGGIGAAVMLVLLVVQTGHPHTGYYHMAALLALTSFFLGVAYTPWMASYTETVEDVNPALTATGLAIWGWLIRVIVFLAFLLLPHVINTVNPLVNYGTQVQTLAAKYAPQLATAAAIHPDTLATLSANPTNSAAIGQAVTQISGTQHVSSAQAVQNLIALSKVPKADLGYLQAHAPAVQKAAKDTPGQWKDWYWICFGGVIFFLLCVPLLKGHFSPAKAKADEEAHEAMVQQEMAKLHA